MIRQVGFGMLMAACALLAAPVAALAAPTAERLAAARDWAVFTAGDAVWAATASRGGEAILMAVLRPGASAPEVSVHGLAGAGGDARLKVGRADAAMKIMDGVAWAQSAADDLRLTSAFVRGASARAVWSGGAAEFSLYGFTKALRAAYARAGLKPPKGVF